MTNYSTALLAAVLAAVTSRSDAFTAPIPQRMKMYSSPSSHFMSSQTETEEVVDNQPKSVKSEDVIPDFSSSTQPTEESAIFSDIDSEDASTTWQENLEYLLAPDTAVAKRQIVLSDLLSAAPEIQESVRTALRERKVSNNI